MRHQTGDVATRSDDPGDGPHAPVRVRRAVIVGGSGTIGVDVAEQDTAVALQRVERRVVGEVATLAMGDRHAQRAAGRGECVGERGVQPFRGDQHVAPLEPQAPVAEQRAGHEAGLGEHLEPVADPEDEPALPREAATERITGLNRAMTPARR